MTEEKKEKNPEVVQMERFGEILNMLAQPMLRIIEIVADTTKSHKNRFKAIHNEAMVALKRLGMLYESTEKITKRLEEKDGDDVVGEDAQPSDAPETGDVVCEGGAGVSEATTEG